jgi:hypothetical protein
MQALTKQKQQGQNTPAGPNSRASCANKGAAKIKIIKLKTPPKTLETAAKPRALPGSPFLAIG